MENKNTNFDILELLQFEESSKDITSFGADTHPENKIEMPSEELSSLDPFAAFESEVSSFSIEKEMVAKNTAVLPTILETPADILADLSPGEEKSQFPKKISFFSKFFGGIIFLVKYLATSSVIFVLLLSITNYSAYIEIARSYLNPDLLEQNKNALLSSVNGAELIEGNKTSSGESVETNTQKLGQVKNKTYHSMDKLLSDTYDENLNMQIDITPYENRVIIPKIGKNIPLLEVKNKTVQNVKELEDTFMNELSNGIIRYPGSAKPGEDGNAFIFGHSSNFPWIKGDYNDVFALLDNVVFGDEIIVYYGQKKFVYKIKEKKIIKPGDVSVLKRSNGKAEISLMTCWPVGTTLNRMIVVGELVK